MKVKEGNFGLRPEYSSPYLTMPDPCMVAMQAAGRLFGRMRRVDLLGKAEAFLSVIRHVRPIR